MKALSGKAFCRLLEENGYKLMRINGSHYIYAKEGFITRISVPVHGSRPLKIGLQRHLIKISGIDEAKL
ncbi:MAG: type II toxin-antitoxin system HicA family toxin [Nitrospirae bacterium]|nr:type II toxin-antitoxin system HicA family toxin [Nitrospirota bacterium]